MSYLVVLHPNPLLFKGEVCHLDASQLSAPQSATISHDNGTLPDGPFRRVVVQLDGLSDVEACKHASDFPHISRFISLQEQLDSRPFIL